MRHFGILAYPAKHSLSPVIHNAAFKHLGLKAAYDFYEVKSEDLAEFVMDNLKTAKVTGLSVSLPHKVAIMACVDQVSAEAQAIGAVNTLVFREGIWRGENTDWVGSNEALVVDGKCDLFGKKVVIIGAGGSARAIVFGLVKAGAKVVLVNRTLEKALKIAKDFPEIEVYSLEELEKVSGDILIHTTSIWLNSKFKESSENLDLPNFCEENFVKQFDLVMDIVYKPLMTPLLKIAQKLGKKIVTGEKMLLYQAVKQFEIWTGKKAPVEVMKTALIGELVEKEVQD